MRLPRMTTWRWILIVAVFALVIGGTVMGVRLKRWHDYFLARVAYHAKREQASVDMEQSVRENLATFERIMDQREERERAIVDYQRRFADRLTQEIAYHSAMVRKYRRDARYPWLPIEPDPPEPEGSKPVPVLGSRG
jgi:hypothetical protein